MISRAAIFAMLVAIAAPDMARADTTAAGPCARAEYRQFDFWIGSWDVYPTDGSSQLVAHSLIESVYNGCGLRENWMPLKRRTAVAASISMSLARSCGGRPGSTRAALALISRAG